MPFVPAPNIVQCEVLAAKDGQIIENRFFVDVFHPPLLSDLQEIATLTTSFCNIDYAPRLTVDCTITGLKLTDMSQQNGIFLQTALTIPGEVAGTSEPNEVSYCLSLRTASRGRSARGRWYWLGMATGQRLDQNRVNTTFRAAAPAALDALRTRLANVGYAWVIVSFIANGAPRVGGPVYFPVTSIITVDDILDSQRRRRPGIGQ